MDSKNKTCNESWDNNEEYNDFNFKKIFYDGLISFSIFLFFSNCKHVGAVYKLFVYYLWYI